MRRIKVSLLSLLAIGTDTLRLTILQCDQKELACSQCIRADKRCPGYRDHLDLSFRNENERIVRKVRSRGQPMISSTLEGSMV